MSDRKQFVTVDFSSDVRVYISNISVVALVKIAGAVAMGAFWTAILVKWFG